MSANETADVYGPLDHVDAAVLGACRLLGMELPGRWHDLLGEFRGGRAASGRFEPLRAHVGRGRARHLCRAESYHLPRETQAALETIRARKRAMAR